MRAVSDTVSAAEMLRLASENLRGQWGDEQSIADAGATYHLALADLFDRTRDDIAATRQGLTPVHHAVVEVAVLVLAAQPSSLRRDALTTIPPRLALVPPES